MCSEDFSLALAQAQDGLRDNVIIAGCNPARAAMQKYMKVNMYQASQGRGPQAGPSTTGRLLFWNESLRHFANL